MPVWEELATDHFDPWQVVPRQVLLIGFSSVCCSLSRWLSVGNRCVATKTLLMISMPVN